MKRPDDTSLPFFAYGIFRPGELALLQIKEFVHACSKSAIPGRLKLRDGLPIAELDPSGMIDGVLIFFRSGNNVDAYQRIADLEPEKQYRWDAQYIGRQKVNVLAGVSPNKGAEYLYESWDGKQDPLFTSALEVVEETLNQNGASLSTLKSLFRLEMAYLLLWTSIERYASLRYHLRDKATQKITKIAFERPFADALRLFVSGKRTVQRADDPTQRCTLDPEDPESALSYYYQVRSNMVHRGKGALTDHERLKKSLEELLAIFRATLQAAFENSRWLGVEG